MLAAVDFGRFMQARIVAEAGVRTGASWGAGILANATQPLSPVYAISTSKCGYGPTCNIEARACAEAAGFPKYSGGLVYQGQGSVPVNYQDCAKNYAASTNTAANVCSPTASQSNPFLSVRWWHSDGTEFFPNDTLQAKVGDMIEVKGVYCFDKLFPWPAIPSPLTWTATAKFTIQP